MCDIPDVPANAHLLCRFLGMVNRPFPSSTNSYFKKGANCETLAVQMGFICVRIKSHFHVNGFALNLALKQIKGLGPLENGLLHVFDKITRGKKERRGVTVNYLYNEHCRDLGLVSLLVGVRNMGTLAQSNVCHLFFPRIQHLSLLSECPL